MNRLESLYNVTKKMEKVFDQTNISKNRETVIEQVNKLIEQRGVILKEIVPPFTEEEKISGKKIVVLNEQIQKDMNLLFDELKQEMQRIKKQKESNKSYVNPYKSVQTIDGMFMDSKQ